MSFSSVKMQPNEEACVDASQLKKVNVASGEDAGFTPAEYADMAWAWHQHEADKQLREAICA